MKVNISTANHRRRRRQKWSSYLFSKNKLSSVEKITNNRKIIMSCRAHKYKCWSLFEPVHYAALSFMLLLLLCLVSTLTVSLALDTNSSSLHNKIVSSSRNSNQQILASFTTPNQAINITHVTYDPLYDTIYLGATNAIYQLNGSDLSEQHEQTTGPVFDNPSCGISDCNGFEDYMKPTQNVNKILVIDYQHQKVLSCGSTKQGACRRYKLNDISQKEDLIPLAVAANDDNSSTYAFIAPARYSAQATPLQQQVLYVATTYTKSVGGQSSRDLLVPAIGTRTLDDGPKLLSLYENSFDSARVDINSHLRDYFLVNYLYGFASSNYIYFVTVQKKATSRDYEELGYHTRLARVCITDSTYNSYTEVDLKCVPNKRKAAAASLSQSAAGAAASGAAGKPSFFAANNKQHHHQSTSKTPSEYPLLQDAILVDAGSHLLQSLALNDQSASGGFYAQPASSPDDNKVLLAVFSSAADHTQHAGEHSALCAFSLAQIEEKFNDNIHNCYTGKMQSRNMEYIAGNVQECPRSGQGGNVVNFCHETLKINGTLPIISEASIQYYNATLTAITATSHVDSNLRNIYSDQLASELAASTATASSFNFSSTTASSSSNSNSNSNSGSQPNTVVFMGTSNGHIKKVLLNNASNGIEFEDTQLDATAPILSDLHLHSSGQHLIAATPYKVMKVPTHNCAQYSTCRECSQSKNPYCGWCSLKRSCTTKSECVSASSEPQPASVVVVGGSSPMQRNNQLNGQTDSIANKQLKWISNESAGKCIDLQSIVPDKIPITSQGKVDLYIDRLPRLPTGHSYKCIFDRRESTTATPTSFGLSCLLPKVMHRPKIQPGRDNVIVDLAVRSSETNTDFLNGKVTFFECQLHTTCKDCLTTNWGCNWCLNENICLYNTSKCEKTSGRSVQVETVQLSSAPLAATRGPLVVTAGPNNQRLLSLSGANQMTNGLGNQRGNTINQVSQCPTFDVGHKQDILIPNGSEKELTIKVKNMPQFKGNIQCIVQIENDKIPLKARIEEDRVICENSSYSYSADVGLLNGQLVVVYSDDNISIDRTNFTMYKCHLLGAYLNRPDCSLCQRIDPRFNCAWCAGTCLHKSQCSANQLDSGADNKCPPPRIDFIHPLSGPTLGGTRVSIEGSNLGQSFEDIANRVTIANVPCKPIEEEYRPSNKIVCITGPVVAATASLSQHLGPKLSSATGRRTFLGADQSSAVAATDDAANGALIINGDVMVGNRAGYSIGPTKFQYKTIQLRDHQPKYGPQSGGTRIVLTGANLNIGSSVQIFLDELPCQIESSSLTAEQIVCRTVASRYPSRAIKQLKLVIDDVQIVREDDVFYYTQDPVITKISPLRSYMSGGRPINVQGYNLTAVQAPRMAIIDAAGKKVNESACIFQDEVRMQCPSPTVNLAMMELEYSEQQVMGSTTAFEPSQAPLTFSGNRAALSQQQQQGEDTVKFRLSFIMDNVVRLRDLQASYPSLNTEISYTNDPKLYTFASGQYRSAQDASSGNEDEESSARGDQSAKQSIPSYEVEVDTYLLQPAEPVLVLYGEHMRSAVSEYEITVTVGQDLCNLTHLSQTKLVCLIPLDHMATPTDEDGHQTQRALPLVVVRIGFNLRYELGYVQYHPILVEQIERAMANANGGQLPYTRYSYPHYVPRENESFLHKLTNYISTILLLVLYALLGTLIVALVYSSLVLGYRLKRRNDSLKEYRKIQTKIDSLEKSVKSECRVASLALQSDLNELIRHVDLSGVPLLSSKSYIMKVFFPGMNNHPLMKSPSMISQQHAADQLPAAMSIGDNSTMQFNHHHPNQFGGNQPSLPAAMSIQRPLKATSDFPMENFERLILTKPFLITFVNTLESQPDFTIRDKVNVGSLIMIILMERLDYATDILRTLLFQLVERSVSQANEPATSDFIESAEPLKTNGSSSLTRKTSNLLDGLPIGKRNQQQQQQHQQSANLKRGLGKVVGGSASSLMASTTVAAQMILSRVGTKTSPLQPLHTNNHSSYLAQNMRSTVGHNMSTTAFNQRNSMVHTIGGAGRKGRYGAKADRVHHGSRTLGRYKHHESCNNKATRLQREHPTHHMLRRTDSVVEKMLTNWLALNMHDYFRGDVGQSLYIMFEALKCQLDRGPIDSVSGDAYYSLNEHKLLREPYIQFEMVNLYIIVDTDILQPSSNSQSVGNEHSSNLLLDNSPSTYNMMTSNSQSIYGDDTGNMAIGQHVNRSANVYSSSNTITLALRVLDCDTIGQVKGKVLNALYRNSPHSMRLGPNDVELSLRQQQSLAVGQSMGTTNGQQYVTVTLMDDDYSSTTTFNGMRRVNTLRHYGVTDQAIMMLNRCRQLATRLSGGQQQAGTRTMLTDVLDEHYNNPYAEIQYGPIGRFDHAAAIQNHHVSHLQRQQAATRSTATSASKSWHLVRCTEEKNQFSQEHQHQQILNSNNSSPSSHSPSMMLLSGDQSRNNQAMNQMQHQQQYYHPSSSSTSSTGNVMNTNSTSANSSSMNVTNLLMKSRTEQPIYCQIGSTTTPSRQGGASSGYYCQIGANNVNYDHYNDTNQNESIRKTGLDHEQESQIYLTRMITSKGTVQSYIDDFFKTILSAKPVSHMPSLLSSEDLTNDFNSVLCSDSSGLTTRRASTGSTGGACPSAVKWLFDLLDEAAMENGISDPNVIHNWKSNAFLLRFWVNIIKNPNYVLDVEKTNTLDSTLSVVAQTLMDSCSANDQKLTKESTTNKLLFAKDLSKYKSLVKRFYQDIASMRPVCDQEIVKQMNALSNNNAGRFDTNLALKELCVYAVNHGVELMNALNNDYTCQQLDLPQQLEQCFRSFTIFEAYR